MFLLLRGLLQLLDGTLTQAHLQVPPDTAVPKKHLTLKKLRKAQRLREEVRAGQPDNSHSRLVAMAWPLYTYIHTYIHTYIQPGHL